MEIDGFGQRVEFYDGIPLKRPLGEFETFYCNAKAKRLLNYAPSHGWRDLP